MKFHSILSFGLLSPCFGY
ncbi:hypothetical protein QTG54_002947 [Skeletonema marinoi]|uniref:Uncharacterized protein n=1 Tax=Skeletonema marinoi TaxID=267567 RepID=A0AAD9DHV9_9STRA|nr:hypothetical protein QTG54_002947 [Skeletonema marinoi]